MYLKQRKNAVGASILVMEVVPFLVLALDVRLGLGCCCCSSPGSFLMVKVDYLVKAISVVVSCVLLSTYFPLSIETLLLLFLTFFSCFLIIVVFCFSLLFADLVAGLVLFKCVSSCSCF